MTSLAMVSTLPLKTSPVKPSSWMKPPAVLPVTLTQAGIVDDGRNNDDTGLTHLAADQRCVRAGTTGAVRIPWQPSILRRSSGLVSFADRDDVTDIGVLS